MHLKTCVMFQLQQGKVEGMARVADPPCVPRARPAMEGHQHQAFEVEHEFLGNGEFPMATEMLERAVSEHHEPMVERTVKDMMAHVAPMVWRLYVVGVDTGQSITHVLYSEVHERGIAVGAVAFIGDPEGADVALLKDVNT